MKGANKMTDEELKQLDAKIRRQCDKISSDARQFIADVEYWNNHRLDCEPLDCEDMKIVLNLATQCEAARNRGAYEEAERLSGKMVRAMVEGV